MSPWLCYYLFEHEDKLTDEIKTRLHNALPLCVMAIRNHTGPVHYDNIWFLKAALFVMTGLVLDQPALIGEAENHIKAGRYGILRFSI
jgi:hypothetical protein